jgi:hypothetical protein
LPEPAAGPIQNQSAPQAEVLPPPASEPVTPPAVDPGPTAAEIALVKAEKDVLNVQILQSDARQAASQADLDKKVYFLGIANSYDDVVRAGILQGEIATIKANMAAEAATKNLLVARVNALPAY